MSFENGNGNGSSPENTRKKVLEVLARYREQAQQDKAEAGYQAAIDDVERNFIEHIDGIDTKDQANFDKAHQQLAEIIDTIIVTTGDFADEGFSDEGNTDIGLHTGTARRALEDAQAEHDNGEHEQATKALDQARDDAKRALDTLTKEIRESRKT